MFGAKDETTLTYNAENVADNMPAIECENEIDGSSDKLASFTEFPITVADERDQLIRNFIDIVNFDRNATTPVHRLSD